MPAAVDRPLEAAPRPDGAVVRVPSVPRKAQLVGYPAHREADVALHDGATVHIRPVRPDDEAGLLAFLQTLSPESLSLRFFSAAVDLPAAARQVSQVDYCASCGLVATVGPEAQIVAHGSYHVWDGADGTRSLTEGHIDRKSEQAHRGGASEERRAEVALAVADRFQDRGLGTLLVGQLAEIGAANGIAVFEAEVLPYNYRMVEVFRQSGCRSSPYFSVARVGAVPRDVGHDDPRARLRAKAPSS